jgi:hypothetical protein
MDCLVTGIAPTSDKTEVETLLAKCQCDPQRLAIISKVDNKALGAHHVKPSMTSAATIMTGSEGTSVPGIGGSSASLSAFGGSHSHATDYLGGLPHIPPDEAQNYNIAIAEGRSLVTYKASAGEAASIETAFREAGLRKVKTFKSKETSLG